MPMFPGMLVGFLFVSLGALAATGGAEKPNQTTAFQAPAITAAILGLGDLYRDGKISQADGDFALKYYMDRSTREGEIFAVIPPNQLITVGQNVSPPDLKSAERTYTIAADLGHPDALLRLADLYLEAGPEDLNKAFSLTLRAEKLGSLDASARLGLMLIRGTGTERDVERGLRYIRMSADRGNKRALMQLGMILRNGERDVIPADPATAFKYFQRAADLGDVAAAVIRARMTIYGEGVPAEPDLGLASAYQLASSGEPGAYLLLGDVSSDGIPGVLNTDMAEAFAAYRRAGELGSQTGTAQTGAMLVQGKGVETNVETGLALLEKAVAEGNEAAMLTLGDFYSHEDKSGLPKNDEKAYGLFQSATQRGNARAKLKVARMQLENRGTDGLPTVGLDLLSALESKGQSEASLVLAEYFSGQLGTRPTRDLTKAYQHYTRAADAGSKTGQLRAALMRVRGLGTRPDPVAGLAMLTGLADGGQIDALLALGDLYATGEIGEINVDRAETAYEAAARLGAQSANIRLGDLFSNAVPADVDRAVAYYRKAARLETYPGTPVINHER